MDEPLSNLDAKLRSEMRTELIQIHKSLSSTFVYVTHDQIEAMTMGDNIVVMDQGLIMQVGSPEEIHDEPANLQYLIVVIGMNIIKLPHGGFMGFRPRSIYLQTLMLQLMKRLNFTKKVLAVENHGSEKLTLSILK